MSRLPGHEDSEAVEAFLAQRLDYLVGRELGDDEELRKHKLKLLREVCRAARNGRLPASMTARYRGILRNLRAEVAAAQKAGVKIPAIVIDDMERETARRESKSDKRHSA
jgi:hypothetical protein